MKSTRSHFAGRNQTSVGDAECSRATDSTSSMEARLSTLKKRLSELYISSLNHTKPLAWNEKFSLNLSETFLDLQDVQSTQFTEDESEKLRSLSSLYELYKRPLKSPRCVLVEGALGSGKSTLLSTIAVNWGQSQRNLAERFDYVFLVRLREVEAGESIEDIIIDQCLPLEDGDIDREVVDHLLHKSKARILFLLDGYDELRAGCKKKKGTIPNLLSGKICKRSHILVSSLPSSGIDEHFKVEQHVLVSGISKDKVVSCIDRYFNAGSRPELALELQSALRDAYTIPDDLLRTPMFLMLLCLVWEDSLDPYRVFSNRMTLTGLYREMLTSAVRRYCRGRNIDIIDEDDFPLNVAEMLQTLGKMALEGLKVHRHLFDVSEVSSDSHDAELLLRLGMVSRAVTVSKCHAREQLSFQHRTMQEFLAARYIVNSHNCTQAVIQALLPSTDASLEYRTLVQFLCGFNEHAATIVFQQLCMLYNGCLKDLREEYYNIAFVGPLSERIRTYNDFIIMCLFCLRESQSMYAVAKVLSPVFHSVNLNLSASCRLSAALKNLLQVAGNDVRQLKLCFQKPGDDAAANYVTSLLSRSFPRLQLDVRLFDCHVRADRMGILAVRLRSAPCLRTLYLEGTHLDDEAAEALAHALFYVPHLEELELSDNQIGDPGLTAISKEIHHVPNLTFFGINDNDVGDASIVAMATKLKHLPDLRELRIGGNTVTAPGLRTFFAVIPNMRNLDTLDVSSSSKDPARMDAKTVAAVVQAFPRLPALVVFKLQNVSMKKVHLERILKAAEENTMVHKIWCSKNLVADVSKIQSRISLN